MTIYYSDAQILCLSGQESSYSYFEVIHLGKTRSESLMEVLQKLNTRSYII